MNINRFNLIRSFFVTVFLVLTLPACKSTYIGSSTEVTPIFKDKIFAGYEDVQVETEDEIFALSSDAKKFVYHLTRGETDPVDKIETLVKAIFDRSDFNMIYDNSANTVAAETFANKAANCLSLSIMTYSLAEQAGLWVRFREIDIPEYWTRKEGFSLINGHINVAISHRTGNDVHLKRSTMTVDFDPFSPKKYFPAKNAGKDRVLAMFYNNKGADALVREDYPVAYAYIKQAIQVDASFQDAQINLGILYRMTNQYQLAEQTYKEALTMQRSNLTILENLAVLYRFQGKDAEADDLLATVDKRRQGNPYYHFILGEQDLDEGEYKDAMVHYKKALHLDSSKHEFYFGMAKTYAAMGNVNGARLYLKKAKRHTKLKDIKKHYQNKINLFASL